MKHCLFLLYAFLLTATASYAQTNYGDYPDTKRKLVFSDDFSDNRHNWPTDMRNGSVKVGKGKYKRSYEAKGDDNPASITTGQDMSGDFEISVRIETPGESDQMFGIYWGGTPKSAGGCLYFAFGAGGGGEYGYSKNGYTEAVNQGTRDADRLNSLGANEILIRRVGAYYYFFLNKNYLFAGDAYELPGSEISFFASWRRNLPTLVVKDLKIYRLQLTKSISLTDVRLNDQGHDAIINYNEFAEVLCEVTNVGEVYLEKIYFKVQVYPENIDIEYKKSDVIDDFKPGQSRTFRAVLIPSTATMSADSRIEIKAFWHDQLLAQHSIEFKTAGLVNTATWTLPPLADKAATTDKNRLQAIDCALSATAYNPARCKNLLEAAIQQKDTMALMWRSFFRSAGLDGAYEVDTERAYEEAVAANKYVFALCEKGNTEAIYLMCFRMQFYGTDNDKRAARYLSQKAADLGYPPAVIAVATYFYQQEKYREAAVYLQKAEQLGVLKALSLSGIFYQKGYGVSKDHIKSLKYFQTAIEKGDQDAYVLLSKYYLDAENPAYSTFQAIATLDKAVAKGCTKAMLELGRLYEYGFQGIQPDDRAALDAYLKAAQAGNTQGMVVAGAYLLYGIDGKTDVAEGVNWITKAAELGNPTGMSLLGMLYQAGLGVEKNIVKARFWLAQSEAKGSAFGNKKPKHQAEYLIDAWFNMDWSPDYWLVEDRFGNERIETTMANPVERGLGSLFEVWANSRKQKQQTINALELIGRKENKRVYAATITSRLKTELYLKKGQTVHLQALGDITLGMFAGTRSAEGTSDPYLAGYSLVPALPHGAFIIRLGADPSWVMAGKKTIFTVPEDGALELAVNDTDWINNQGYFDVKIEVVDP